MRLQTRIRKSQLSRLFFVSSIVFDGSLGQTDCVSCHSGLSRLLSLRTVQHMYTMWAFNSLSPKLYSVDFCVAGLTNYGAKTQKSVCCQI